VTDNAASSWDPTLFAGSAPFYSRGRVAYPPGLVEEMVARLALDGSGRLLDIGCGPGSIGLMLAPHYAEVVGVDADADMIAEATRLAEASAVQNATWCNLRAEDLPAGLGQFRTAVFAQSFHWMDRHRVARSVHDMLDTDGAVVHVHATTHRGGDDTKGLGPRPPYADITRLVQRYLGKERRAGQRTLPAGTPGDEVTVYRAAGFLGPERVIIPPWTVDRSVDDVAASIYSLSSSAPHLFGKELSAFDVELRVLLNEASNGRAFSERMSPVALDIWRPGAVRRLPAPKPRND
jgi:SAM-dependent methyltransferase